MTTAIGTGAALGVPVAVIGTVGYVFSGWQVASLPPYAYGFVYGPALLGIVAGSVLHSALGCAGGTSHAGGSAAPHLRRPALCAGD